MLNGIIAITVIGIFLAIVEWLTIALNIPRAHSRKVIHVGTSLLVIAIAFLFGWKLFIFLGLLFILVLGATRIFHPLESLNDRSQESYGEILFPLGVACAAFICQTNIDFTIAILILGISDTAAFYLGRAVKSRKLIHQKSIAGSGAFLISAFLIGLITASPLLALGVALSTTLAELCCSKGIDNLLIPIVASITLTVF